MWPTLWGGMSGGAPSICQYGVPFDILPQFVGESCTRRMANHHTAMHCAWLTLLYECTEHVTVV